MRVSNNSLNASLKKEIFRSLNQLIADFRDPDEVSDFFNNFLSSSEYEMIAKRLAIIYWLKKGRSYSNIKENLKVSSATIAGVQNSLEKDGIKTAIKKIEAEEWASKWAEKFRKFVK